jgi:hypothetical protein
VKPKPEPKPVPKPDKGSTSEKPPAGPDMIKWLMEKHPEFNPKNPTPKEGSSSDKD